MRDIKNKLIQIQPIILAAGKGKRMDSEIPKALLPLRQKPMIFWVIESLKEAGLPDPIIVVGHRAEDVIAAAGAQYEYVIQREQLGSGHAVKSAKEMFISKANPVKNILVVYADHPLVSSHTLQNIALSHLQSTNPITMASIKIPDFSDWRSAFWGFGRIIRNGEGRIYRVVELKDASQEEQWVTDLNPSYFCFNSDWLWTNLEKISNNNAQKEYYLTDITKIARDEGILINEYPLSDIAEAMGANTPAELRRLHELAELRISGNHIGQSDQEPNENAETTNKKRM